MENISAPGKVILFGEFAVLYGQPAVAGAISLRCNASFKKTKENGRIAFKDYTKPNPSLRVKNVVLGNKNNLYETLMMQAQEGINLSEMFPSWYSPFVALSAKFEYDNPQHTFPKDYLLKVRNYIPKGCGAGSAIAASTVAAFYNYFQGDWERKDIENIVSTIDYFMHGGKSSGIDAKTIVWGGFQRKKKDGTFGRIIDIKTFPILIVNSGVQAKTKNQTKKLDELVKNNSKAIDIIQEIGEITTDGIHKLVFNNLEDVGELMYENHLLLKKLNLSCKELDIIVETAIDLGAYGAKMTGAGGGGSAIVLASEDYLHYLKKEFEKQGFFSQVRYVGVGGVRKEENNHNV